MILSGRGNRVCYGVLDGQSQLRIEIRDVAGWPTVVGEVANAALQFGLLAALDQESGHVEKRLRFEDAKYNFLAAARHGLGSQFTWLNRQRQPANALILKELLPFSPA